ncbi:MAG TPA: citrate synthase [Stellaceae bacterium]|nr:citrate synthase [Stellaceae bacterium]
MSALRDLPLLHPTLGPAAIDIGGLYAGAGLCTYDPGLGTTAICRSAITYVDGANGVLLYRGYPIDALVEGADFLDVCTLLLDGELPDSNAREEFARALADFAELPEPLPVLYRGFARDAHPMAMMAAAASGLAGHFHDSCDIFDPAARRAAAMRLIAVMPVVAAMAYRHRRGEPFIPPRADLGYAENFLAMLFAAPGAEYRPPAAVVEALDALLIIQADHEQNASTTAMRLVGSTRADPCAALAAAILTLWGPLHGGANEGVLETLAAIGHIDRIPEILRRAKDKNDPFRLMGFGHRVYKSYDPRAKVLRRRVHAVLAALGRNDDPLLELALALERVALEDEYFVARKLYPNVDFYSGLIFRALGLPPEMFTPVFAVARTAGWLAQWHEMMADPETRLVRPRQLYVGPPERELAPRRNSYRLQRELQP